MCRRLRRKEVVPLCGGGGGGGGDGVQRMEGNKNGNNTEAAFNRPIWIEEICVSVV